LSAAEDNVNGKLFLLLYVRVRPLAARATVLELASKPIYENPLEEDEGWMDLGFPSYFFLHDALLADGVF
jgi:hypothetical protein